MDDRRVQGSLLLSRYRTIVADPPWDHSDGTGKDLGDADHRRKPGAPSRGRPRVTGMPYQPMTLDEIAALPVYEMSDNVDQDAHLYLWTTSRFLSAAFGIVEAWGFHYTATLVWCKPSRGWSTGGQFQNNVEFVLFANRPKIVTRVDAAEVSSWLYEKAQAAGVSEDDINAHMGTRRMAMWWISRNPRMAAVPRAEQWERLRDLIGFGHEMDARVREINAAKGTNRISTTQACTTRWFTWPRAAHSAKPDAFLDLVEQVSCGPYAELFARRARFGWDYPIGDQALGGEMTA